MTHWRMVLAVAGVVAGSFARLAGQDVAAMKDKQPTQVEAKGRITGLVICADTHRPARGAMVVIGVLPSEDGKESGAQPSAMTRTGMDGRFTEEHLGPGEYSVMAFYPGYISPVAGMSAGADPKKAREIMAKNGTVVVRGAETETFDVVLARGAAVGGRVLYADGSPAAQVTIEVEDVKAKAAAKLEDADVESMVRMMLMHQSPGTDDQGRFRVAGLPAGTYRVSAVQTSGGSNDMDENGFGVIFGTLTRGALHFYSGDTIHKKAAKTYELRPGDEVADIAITIPETLFHRVSGTVTTLSGATIQDGTARLTDASDKSMAIAIKLGGDTDGAFEFPMVPPGTYTLEVSDAKTYLPPAPVDPAAPPAQVVPPPRQLSYEAVKMTVLVKDGDVADVQLSLKEKAAAEDQKPVEAPTPVVPQ